MQESLPIAEGHDPTTSAVETSRNSQDIPHHFVSSFTALSCPMPCSPAPAGHCHQHWSLTPGTWGGLHAQGQAVSIPFRSYWENATMPRGMLQLYGTDWVEDENIKLEMGWSHRVQMCVSVYRDLMWERICVCCVSIHIYRHTSAHEYKDTK